MGKIIVSIVVLNCIANIFLAIAMRCNARDIAELEVRMLFPELYQKRNNKQ